MADKTQNRRTDNTSHSLWDRLGGPHKRYTVCGTVGEEQREGTYGSELAAWVLASPPDGPMAPFSLPPGSKVSTQPFPSHLQ